MPDLTSFCTRFVGQTLLFSPQVNDLLQPPVSELTRAQYNVESLCSLLHKAISLNAITASQLSELLNVLNSESHYTPFLEPVYRSIFYAQTPQLNASTKAMSDDFLAHGIDAEKQCYGTLIPSEDETTSICFVFDDILQWWHFDVEALPWPLRQLTVPFIHIMAIIGEMECISGIGLSYDLIDIVNTINNQDINRILELDGSDDDAIGQLSDIVGHDKLDEILDYFLQWEGLTPDEADDRQSIFNGLTVSLKDIQYDRHADFDDGMFKNHDDLPTLLAQFTEYATQQACPIATQLSSLCAIALKHLKSSTYEFDYGDDNITGLGFQQLYYFGKEQPNSCEARRIKHVEDMLLQTGESVSLQLDIDCPQCLAAFHNIQLGWLTLSAVQQLLETPHV